jgi:hypothetical protein
MSLLVGLKKSTFVHSIGSSRVHFVACPLIISFQAFDLPWATPMK